MGPCRLARPFWYIYRKKEGSNVLFNDALSTFYLWLYGVRHMVEDHTDSERENLLLPHRQYLFGTYIYTHTDAW